MIRTSCVALALVLATSATAWADTTFTITIRNNSAQTWSQGVLAVMPEAGDPNALLNVGGVPTAGDQLDTLAFVHNACNITAGDDGDAALLIARWGFAADRAQVVPSLAGGASVTLTFTADPGEVLSYVARVSSAGDDPLIMHAVGNTSDTTIDLFDGTGLPLPAVRFTIGGFDANSTDAGNGDATSCAGSCPWNPNNCFVAPGNGTVGLGAGGAQATPFDFDTPAWTVVESGFTPDGIAVGNVHPADGNELVVMMEGSTWFGRPVTPGTGKSVVLRANGNKLREFLPSSGRDIMGMPLIEVVNGTIGYLVAEFLGSGDGGAVYALPGGARTPSDAHWIMTPMDWPGLWNQGASSANVIGNGSSGIELVIPSWGGLVNIANPTGGAVLAAFDVFDAFGEILYGHAAIGNVAATSGNEIVLVGGSEGRVIVLDPLNAGGVNLVHVSNAQPGGYALGSGAAIGNIDDDPQLEIVVAFYTDSGAGYVQAFDFQNDNSGGCEYQWDAPSAPAYFWTSPVIGDVDGDGDNEVIVQTNDSTLSILTTEGIAQTPGTCRDGGFLVQAYQVGGGGASWWTPALGNLHSSPGVEIVAASYDTLEVLYFENGRLNVAYRAVEPSATFYPSAAIEPGSAATSSPSARIYVSGWINGAIYRFNTPNNAPVPNGWLTMMGNNARTGLAQ